MKFNKLERILLEKEIVFDEQLLDAKKKSMGSRRPVQDELIDMGFLTEDKLLDTMRELYPELKCVDLQDPDSYPGAVDRVPYDLTQKYNIAPLGTEGNILILAMSNPGDLMAIDDIETVSGMVVRPVLSKKTEIENAIETLYKLDKSVYDLYKNLGIDSTIDLIEDESQNDDNFNVQASQADAQMAPVIRLVNLFISDAIRMRASDIHIEPSDDDVDLRYRIDGALQSIMTFPKHLHAAVISRIKIMSSIDIAERRKPQDGAARVKYEGRHIDLRISTIPTFSGEKVVVRILDSERGKIALNNIGFGKNELAVYKNFLFKHQGMILVTGPTGSGKTTTLYGSLMHLNDGKQNITSVENPVEYQIKGINQIQINPLAGVTFASSLRSILRQDPNVIFVGEIRDLETAEIAFQAAQTGHLVLSTLHTMGTISTISRLVDIGVESFLISSSLIAVVAQRLVRVICSECKTAAEPDPQLLDKTGVSIPSGVTLFAGEGCEHCNFTGFYGRTAIFEILDVDEDVMELISKGATEGEILKAARGSGMTPLADAALQKVFEGETTLEEAVEVAGIKKTYGSKAAERKGGLMTILLVEDDKSVRKMVKASLSREPFRIVEAENGKEGVEKAHQVSPDLIIMDIMMPVMDGITACKKLKSNLQTGHIPLMMLTAKDDDDSEKEGFQAGADDYVSKPVTPKKLVTRINKLLGRSQVVVTT